MNVDGECTFIDFNHCSTKAAWIPYPGAVELSRMARQKHPAGVNSILIGLLKVPGYQIIAGKNGNVAILLGLLLPAVQTIREPGSAERMILCSALATKGMTPPATGNQVALQAAPRKIVGVIDVLPGLQTGFLAVIDVLPGLQTGFRGVIDVLPGLQTGFRV